MTTDATSAATGVVLTDEAATKVRNLLTILPVDDLKDILENGPFPVESRCHHCSTSYFFSRQEIQKIYGVRYPNN